MKWSHLAGAFLVAFIAIYLSNHVAIVKNIVG
jgi:hypothetical protein